MFTGFFSLFAVPYSACHIYQIICCVSCPTHENRFARKNVRQDTAILNAIQISHSESLSGGFRVKAVYLGTKWQMFSLSFTFFFKVFNLPFLRWMDLRDDAEWSFWKMNSVQRIVIKQVNLYKARLKLITSFITEIWTPPL